uniref:Uncharacterized protein n=1 Tax=Fusarium oxysporum (strain Fo5176) TaxID=660025 RepID=A0A0D2Y138_FUSOF
MPKSPAPLFSFSPSANLQISTVFSHVQILRITIVIKNFNNNSTMASKKTLRDVSSETKSRNSPTPTIASAASSAAATTLTTPSGVQMPDRKRTGTSAHAEEMSSWLFVRAAKRQLDKQALEAEIADDVEKAAGWKITAEKLTSMEAGSSIDELFAAALEKKKAEEAEPSDVKAEPFDVKAEPSSN